MNRSLKIWGKLPLPCGFTAVGNFDTAPSSLASVSELQRRSGVAARVMLLQLLRIPTSLRLFPCVDCPLRRGFGLDEGFKGLRVGAAALQQIWSRLEL